MLGIIRYIIINSIDKHRLPCSHVGVKETPFTLCKRPDFYFVQVDEELVFADAVIVHPVFFCQLSQRQDIGDASWVEP